MADEHELLQRAERQAEEALATPARVNRISARAREKAERYRGRLGDAFGEIQAITRLLTAWAQGRYRVVPMRTLVALLGALLYFLMPLDAVPDFILALGMLDDAAIIARVIQIFRDDLKAFRQWEQASQEKITREGTDDAE
ncbi:MAG: DUF1232 domain-containing protein [Alcanivoracaceae bacterium]|jgi:uncharacterized membrane protein YkvA (DUF1232 family)|nr:DUF1232 domain-containing protein [Alcanivoracaceae bacterium]